MSRSRIIALLVVVLAAGSTQAIRADVHSEQRTKFQLAGALGRVVNMFGGKAAREGVTSTTAVKGSRKLTMSDATGQIIDLSEEKIYDLDMKKKTYRVTTFADIRKQMEEARKKAEEDVRKAQAEEKSAKPDPDAKEMEVDFEVKNTGEKKDINGFSTSQAIMTITVREKGKTLQQGGGFVLTSDMWMAASIPAMREVAEFDLKYAEKLYGPTLTGASAHIRAGRIRGVAICSKERSPQMPELAPVSQVLPGFDVISFAGIGATGGSPKPIVAKLNSELQRILSDADVKSRWLPIGLEPAPTTPEAFDKIITDEIRAFAAIARAANTKAE